MPGGKGGRGGEQGRRWGECEGAYRLPVARSEIAPDFVALTKLFSELKLPFGTFASLAEAIARHREYDALMRKN